MVCRCNGLVAANALEGRVGAVSVGPILVPTTSNAFNSVTPGAILVEKLDLYKMWLPTTMPDISRSHAADDQCTFKPRAKSKPARIDYVAISDDIHSKEGSARTLGGIDMRNKGEDHIPAGVEIRCGKGGGLAPYRMRKVRYDRTKTKLEPFAKDYSDSVRGQSMLKYETEPTSHQFLLANALETTLVEVCGAPALFPVKQHIAAETVSLSQIKGAALSFRTEVARRVWQASVRGCFVLWKVVGTGRSDEGVVHSRVSWSCTPGDGVEALSRNAHPPPLL